MLRRMKYFIKNLRIWNYIVSSNQLNIIAMAPFAVFAVVTGAYFIGVNDAKNNPTPLLFQMVL